MASGQTRGKYTAQFKFETVPLVMAEQAIFVVSKVLNIPKASLSNWVRQGRQGSLSGSGVNSIAVVTPEQMEPARLRVEVARLRMERDIAKKPRLTRCAGHAASNAWIHQMRNKWPVSIAREVLEVSVRRYFSWLRRRES